MTKRIGIAAGMLMALVATGTGTARADTSSGAAEVSPAAYAAAYVGETRWAVQHDFGTQGSALSTLTEIDGRHLWKIYPMVDNGTPGYVLVEYQRGFYPRNLRWPPPPFRLVSKAWVTDGGVSNPG